MTYVLSGSHIGEFRDAAWPEIDDPTTSIKEELHHVGRKFLFASSNDNCRVILTYLTLNCQVLLRRSSDFTKHVH